MRLHGPGHPPAAREGAGAARTARKERLRDGRLGRNGSIASTALCRHAPTPHPYPVRCQIRSSPSPPELPPPRATPTGNDPPPGRGCATHRARRGSGWAVRAARSRASLSQRSPQEPDAAATAPQSLVLRTYKNGTTRGGENRESSGTRLGNARARGSSSYGVLARVRASPREAQRQESGAPRSTEIQHLSGRWKLVLERAVSLGWRPLTFGDTCPLSSCTGAGGEQVSSLHKVFFQGHGSSLKGVDVALYSVL